VWEVGFWGSGVWGVGCGVWGVGRINKNNLLTPDSTNQLFQQTLLT
jgi:hypothetical protein